MGLDYVSKKYTLPIKVAIAEITGVNYEIRFILPEEVKQEKAPAPVQKNLYVPNLNPKYTFDTFVVGRIPGRNLQSAVFIRWCWTGQNPSDALDRTFYSSEKPVFADSLRNE